jgi:protein-disulfide isomerase
MEPSHPIHRFELAVPLDRSDHVLGPETAAVVVIEYGDFECPNCRQAYPAVKQLLQHFQHRIRFAYRHFPLTEIHPHAQLAAEAAEAAAAQGKFWRMHDTLFEHQLHLKQKDLRRYAETLELDVERFDYELTDQVYRQRVNEHVEGGRRSGVRSTPTFFVDGLIADVSFGLDHLFEALEKRLLALAPGPSSVQPTA